MKQSVNRSAFHDAFINMGRKEQFSYEARNALFDYLEQRREKSYYYLWSVLNEMHSNR